MLDVEIQETINQAVEQAMQQFQEVDRKVTTPDDAKDDDAPEKAGFKSFGDYLCAVKNDPERCVKAGLSEGVDSAGGFLVPEEFRAKILMDALEKSVIRPNGPTVIPMRSDTLLIPRVVDTSHDLGTSVFGGVVAYWTEEAGTKTVKEPTFGNVKLIAKKLTGYTYASDELLADSAIGLEALLTRMFGEALAWYEDEAFIEGSGVGEPLGFMNSGAYGTTSTRATSTSVILTDLARIWSDLLPQSYGRAVWLANPEVILPLAQLASTTLTWLKLDQGVAKSMPATIFGRPIYFSEKMPALGSAGDICLVDLSYYLIGDRQRLTIASSPHVRFLTDETAWRFIQRVDGQPWMDSGFTPKYGGTLYPFVGLGT